MRKKTSRVLSGLSVLFLFSMTALPAFAQDVAPPSEQGQQGQQQGQNGFQNGQQNGQNNGQHGGPQNFGNWNGNGNNMGPQDLEGAKKQFLNDRGFMQTVKTIQRLMKKVPAGYAVSQEIRDALAQVDALNAAVQNAADMEAVSDARDDLNEAMDVLRQAEWQLRSIGDFVRMGKQGMKELTKLSKKLTKFEAGMAKDGVDMSDLIASARAAVELANTALQKAVQSAKSGNVEDAQSEFQDFFEGLGETWQSVGMLDAVRGISKGISMIEKNVSAAKKRILALSQKNKKLDASEVLDLLDEASDKVAELKSLVKSSDFQPEDAMSIFMELNDLRQQIEMSVTETFGGDGMDINFFPMEMGRMPNMNFQGPGSGSGHGGGPQGGQGGGPQDGGNFGPQGGGFGPQGGGFGPQGGQGGGNNFGPQGGQQNF